MFFLSVSILILISLFSPNSVLAFVFASWSDTQDNGVYSQNVAKKIATLNPNLVIFTGDLEDTGFSTSEMNTMVKAINGDTTGTTSTGLFNKTFLARGNHDNQRSGSATGWSDYLNNQLKATNLGIRNYTELDSDLTYSFDYDNSRFVAIDVPDGGFLTTRQVDWVGARLTDAETNHSELVHAFIYFHIPIYFAEKSYISSAKVQYFIQMTNNHPLLSAIFVGHIHQFHWYHIDSGKISGVTRHF